MSNKILFFILLFAGGFVSPSYAHEASKDIVVSSAWVRVMPPSQLNTAAYMTIENKSDKEIVLQYVSTNAAEISEMHQMSHTNGMMKMQQVDRIAIPAKNKVVLEPGGWHIMLIHQVKPFKKGESVPILLNFQDGKHLEINAIAGDEIPDDSKKPCCLPKH